MTFSDPLALDFDFAERLIAWQRVSGRHALPWQVSQDPYPVWVSEIMLQQTQVETVIPYYRRFIERFPDVAALAAAAEDDVLAHWSGLGYYSRARNLHAAAQKVMHAHGGRFPADATGLQGLPGIGRTTAAAIAAFAYGQRGAILDGNVKRVFARVFGVEGWPGEPAVEKRLWALAEVLLPQEDIARYTQGLMDLGATVCTRGRPRCGICPFANDCLAHGQGRQRELPGTRPRKTLPERAVAMLVLHHAGEVCLEKRPARGIWGGLWGLPECEAAASPAEAAVGLGFAVHEVRALPGLRHVFTHFRLAIAPWAISVASQGPSGPGRVWLPGEDLEGAAVPTPVRRILQMFFAEASRG